MVFPKDILQEVEHFRDTLVLIDQHFSERQRLSWLLSAIAQNPDLIGVGIDEDTALVISQQGHIKVLGTGAVTVTVTLLDGHHLYTNVIKNNHQESLELNNVVLHFLPAGTDHETRQKFCISAHSSAQKELIDTLRFITKRGL